MHRQNKKTCCDMRLNRGRRCILRAWPMCLSPPLLPTYDCPVQGPPNGRNLGLAVVASRIVSSRRPTGSLMRPSSA
ncbi:hypothetical protein VFPBJ_04007 [Purpureocillium lilacinum]|uniref:Uncharacterized protein n=1 Tax=Purpureocillium lilacinum TaxID=33203 RepID=A0A179GVT9_PURLI|nr:hypothetical protein VFPBJ_04007 [Purpureocillium lilacinum]